MKCADSITLTNDKMRWFTAIHFTSRMDDVVNDRVRRKRTTNANKIFCECFIINYYANQSFTIPQLIRTV